ncbi:T9SS type A sorting domain-containing protein [Lishizhenia tianjinensis]|nr:DUF4465 domain-containing protein [Lishizhenia tianjinensis]
MKKFYLMAALVLGAGFTQAQNQVTVDFESLTLPTADTFYVFTDSYAPFTENGVTFGANLGSWGTAHGFVYSNMTDVTTAGYTNPYSAFAGEGANGSEQYAVFNNTDTLWFEEERILVGADFVNNTYAGISMRDGDQFAKQFGSTTNADGVDDGTNGEDFFFVRIYGWDANFDIVDSVDVYLADFRGTDAQDYILDEWTTFDLSALSGSMALTFGFQSSDVGQWGMNTPAYFAIDNLEYIESNLGVNDVATVAFDMYPNPATTQLNIKAEAGDVAIYNTQGALVKTAQVNTIIDVADLEAGVYFVKVSHEGALATQRLVIQ